MTDHRGKGPSFSELEPQVKARLHLINHRVCTEIEQGIKELRTRLRNEGRPEEIFADGPKYYKQVLPDRGKELLEEIGKDIRERSIIFTPADGKRLEELVGNIFASWLDVGQEHFNQFANEFGRGFEDIIDPGLQYIASVLIASLKVKVEELRTGHALSSVTFPTPPGTKWEDIEISYRDGNTLRIKVGELKPQFVSYNVMGFMDGRHTRPTRLWELLTKCIEDGEINWRIDRNRSETAKNYKKDIETKRRQDDQLNERTGPSEMISNQIKKQKERLSKQMRLFFGLTDDPFREYREANSWRPRFKIGKNNQG